MKISSCLLGLIGLGWIIYCLFQPVIDMNIGWKPIPDEAFNTKFHGIEREEYTNEIARSKLLIDSIQAKTHIPSLSIAAMINGKMVWTYALGFRDLKKEISADTNTLYRIGSTSKALTALGLGKLIQTGKIHPDSSIQYYSGLFSDKPRITIRQLASHQSGIRNYGVCLCTPIWEYYRNSRFGNVEESVLQFESDELLFYPGDDFSYATFNFTALSLAMENVTCVNFLDFMDHHVFQAIGMSRTCPDMTGKFRMNNAIPYETRGHWFHDSFEVDLSNKWAGGGFLSTPSDLVRAGNVLLDSSYLTRKTIDLITNPQRLNNDSINEQSYALGWRRNLSKRYFNGDPEIEVIHHGGMAVGGQALLVVYPEYDLVIALTMNKSGGQGSFELFKYVTPIGELFISRLMHQ